MLFGVDISGDIVGKVGANFQININSGYEDDPSDKRWMTMAFGIAVGGSLNPGASFTLKSSKVNEISVLKDLVYENIPKSKCELIQPNDVKFTSERNIWDLSISWLRFFGIGYVLGPLGDEILKLIREVKK